MQIMSPDRIIFFGLMLLILAAWMLSRHRRRHDGWDAPQPTVTELWLRAESRRRRNELRELYAEEDDG